MNHEWEEDRYHHIMTIHVSNLRNCDSKCPGITPPLSQCIVGGRGLYIYVKNTPPTPGFNQVLKEIIFCFLLDQTSTSPSPATPPIIITMGKKRVLVSYGVDIDAVAGWLGSYGGEDSVSDISRGKHMCLTDHCRYTNKIPQRSLGRARRHTPRTEAIRKIQHQSNMVHPRSHSGHLPGRMRNGPGCRPRDRVTRLLARESLRLVHGTTARHPRQDIQDADRLLRKAAAWNCCAMVGGQCGDG